MQEHWGLILSGAAAGGVCGLLGTGGGMLLVPLLTMLTHVPSGQVFFASVAVMLPVALTSLVIAGFSYRPEYLPFLIGSAVGGSLAGALGHKISVSLLHKGLGLLILWAGVRYLC